MSSPTTTQWREMSTGPAQEDTVERDENRASTGRQCREMSRGPAQEDSGER